MAFIPNVKNEKRPLFVHPEMTQPNSPNVNQAVRMIQTNCIGYANDTLVFDQQ